MTYKRHQHATVAANNHMSSHSLTSRVENSISFTPKRSLFDPDDSSRYMATESGPSGLSLRMSLQTPARGKDVKELQDFLNLNHEPDDC